MSVVCKVESDETFPVTIPADPACGERHIKEEEVIVVKVKDEVVVKEEEEETVIFEKEAEREGYGAPVSPLGKFSVEPWRSDVNKRDGPRVDHTEQEDTNDDHYLYCEECKSYFLEECAIHGPPLIEPDTPVVMGASDRARLTLPHGLEVRRSGIPGAGLGVFNCGEVVAKGTHYGPYDGEVMEEEAMESGYCWVIRTSRGRHKYINARRETHSNWMRYVKCARDEGEQNMVAFQYRGGILYRCCRPLAAGEELLVWYGQEYRYKNISFHYFQDKSNGAGVMTDLSQNHVYRAQLPAWKSADTDESTLFHCDQCGKNFNQATDLMTHQRVHIGEKLYRCDQCGKTFSQPEFLVAHQRVHTGKKLCTCEQCGKYISQPGDSTHQCIHRSEKLYRCDQCGKNFNQLGDLKRHQRVHTGEKPYHCDECGRNFSRSGLLKRHQLVHTGEKPYNCDQCGKNFSRAVHLQKHQRFHMGEKPYHCNQCGKDFSQARVLKAHLRIHTGEKPYHCDQCGKNYGDSGSLKSHQRLHTGEMPYQCDRCGRKFRHAGSLTLHQRVHTGEQYHCDWCGKKFTTKGHLKIHQHLHTGELFQCDQCGKNFTIDNFFRTHPCVNIGGKPCITLPSSVGLDQNTQSCGPKEECGETRKFVASQLASKSLSDHTYYNRTLLGDKDISTSDVSDHTYHNPCLIENNDMMVWLLSGDE